MKIQKEVVIGQRRIITTIEDDTVTSRDADGCNQLLCILSLAAGEVQETDKQQ